MYLLEEIEIHKFWDTRTFALQVHPDVNFLIGVNGSGKTTVVKLVAAALDADFQELDRLPFQTLRLKFKDDTSPRKPIIEVRKTPRKRSPFSGIKYRIFEMSSGPAVEYSLDDIEEQLMLRNYPHPHFRRMLEATGLIPHIAKFARFSWLSIQRAEILRDPREQSSHISSVDRKLHHLSGELVKYFSGLSRAATQEADHFQSTVFLSLIAGQDPDQLFSDVGGLDQKTEQQALADIFAAFKVPKNQFAPELRQFFTKLKSATKKLEGSSTLDVADLVGMVGAWRIHSVVREWNKLVKRQEVIYRPRDTFLKILTSMMQRKSLELTNTNELVPISDSGTPLLLTDLSSGEKQLIIILGEALLQRSAPCLYIADEPELSLHVKWQEMLIPNLLEVNPKAQILFATHSPDIVGHYSENVFDMEKVLA